MIACATFRGAYLALWALVAAFACPAGAEEVPVTFVDDVVPILTKAGCNAGACHAKAGAGQRGFQLSLLGFEPQEDYEHIVKEARGRRVFRAAPEQSLLVMKAANIVPHGGGEKLTPGTETYDTLVAWIEQGLVYSHEADGELIDLQIEPAWKSMPVHTSQQLKVTAHYSNGTTRDVTNLALYEPNDTSMAEADESGHIETADIPGKVAVMVRFASEIRTFDISIPLGAPVENLPPTQNFIDELVFQNLEAIGIPPSPVIDDSTFLRRVSLDIAGRLPTEAETTEFLKSTEPDKRGIAIDRLLATADYADYFANKWTALLKNQRESKADITANFAFHSWVRDGMLANKPYDQMVREILGATGTIVANPAVAWYKRVKEPNQQLEDVAQLFLGVRMQCAQCHHHPFERWSQDDYYAFAAYFSQVGRKPTAIAGEDLIFHKRGIAEMQNPKTLEKVKPAALGQTPVDIPPDDDPRLRLADWMSAPENPFFAKALVNRYWKHFFRRGLVEPEDDIRDTNPATNPELLDALANHFIESDFDLKDLIATITESQAYQLSAMPNAHNGVDRQNFSRFYPKRMQAEVLLDALDGLAESKTDFADLPPGTRAISLPDNSYNGASPFLKVFGRPEGSSVCECERVQSSSLAQSLHLMNSADVRAKLSAKDGRAARLADPELPIADGVDEIYLAAFSRKPSSEEFSIAENHLLAERTDASDKPLDPKTALRHGYEDLIWAILNTKEFLYNH